MKSVKVIANGTILNITIDVADYEDSSKVPRMILDIEEKMREFMHGNRPIQERLDAKKRNENYRLFCNPGPFEPW